MCSVLYTFSNSKLMLCPDSVVPSPSNATPSSNDSVPSPSTPSLNDSVPSPSSASINDSVPSPSNATPSLNDSVPSPSTPSLNDSVPSPSTPSLNDSVPSPSNATPSLNDSVPSPSEQWAAAPSPNGYGSICAPCNCVVSGNAPSPTLLGSVNKNQSDASTSPLIEVDYSWLHAFWALIPLIGLLVYGFARKKCCARMRVGFLTRRYTATRARSWPIASQQSHPAAIPRSKSTNFDSIVI